MKKGTQLLEIYALEIQMYTAQKNNKKLKVSVSNSIFVSLFCGNQYRGYVMHFILCISLSLAPV